MKALRKEARSGHEAKVRRISGSHGTVKDPTGDMNAPDTVQVGPQQDSSIQANGERPKQRLDRPARAMGGRVPGKKGTNINIIVGGQKPEPQPVPVPVPPPMMKPPGPPPGPPPGAAPGPGAGAPMGNGPMGPLGGMPMRKFGGRVHSKRDAQGKFSGGAVTGVGRLEKASNASKRG